MSDDYDKAVAYLTARPAEIFKAWQWPMQLDEHPAHILFGYCNYNPHSAFLGRPHDDCGCLTQVKAKKAPAATVALTEAIRADERLPEHAGQINAVNLPAFAEWQRRLDKELERTPGVWKGPDVTV